jgi:hypothetical protein
MPNDCSTNRTFTAGNAAEKAFISGVRSKGICCGKSETVRVWRAAGGSLFWVQADAKNITKSNAAQISNRKNRRH